MLSIGAMKSGQEQYYLKLAREDYYLEGGEPAGHWFGEGAQQLGLKDTVQKEELSALFQGLATNGEALLQNSGKANRQPGWDLTFSAPKSVSFIWSQLAERGQQEILASHRAAVAATLSHLEKHFAFSRVGKGGTERVPVGLVVGVFEHCTSRALDMQLHTHSLVMNIGIDDERKARSILSKPFYEAKMLAGPSTGVNSPASFNSGWDWNWSGPSPGVAKGEYIEEKKAAWFEVKGVPKSILSHFSKRRKAILQELGKRGLESASAAAFAALGTRETKTLVPPRSELFARWKQEGWELGFSPKKYLSQPRILSEKQTHQQFQTVLAEAVAQITTTENYFTQSQITQRTLEISQEHGLPAEMVAQGVAAELVLNPSFISLGSRQAQSLWTTQEVLDVEKDFRSSIEVLRGRDFVGVSEATCQAVLSKPRGQGSDKFFLDKEQQEAVRYITQGKESVKIVSGFAGTGKTDMLAAAKEALEIHGYRVIGTALAGVAARNLAEKTGIESESIRMRELQLHPDTSYVLKHHARQLWRAARGKETYSLPILHLGPKTVLVIDEAGMVGVHDFSMLAKAVVERGGSVIAIGDERQLSAIERPGSFDYLVKELSGVRLTEIRRQKDPADQAAVKEIVFGNPEAALEHYAEKGQFFVSRSRGEAEEELVSNWARAGGTKAPTDHRIFAGTRGEVDRLNKLCQWERIQAGVVDASDRVEHNGQFLMAGDRVRFDLSERKLGIKKGEGGTILSTKDGLTGKYVAIALDPDQTSFKERFLIATKHHAQQVLKEAMGKRTEKLTRRQNVVVVPLETLNPFAKTYQGLSLDYAMTTHLGQGQTVENAYVLLGGKMGSRELTYVQSSRHQQRLSLYATEEEAGHRLTELARTTLPVTPNENEGPREIPSYAPLISQMKRSEAQELASLHKQPQEEILHAR